MLISIISVRNTRSPLPQPHVLLGEPFERVLLAQWISLPLVGQEDSSQIGVPVELHAEQVEDFPLVPLGRVVDRRGRQDRFSVSDMHLQSKSVIPWERVDVIDNLES